MDVFGRALTDHYKSGFSDTLMLHNNYGKPETMPIEVFFREESELPELESYALTLCTGHVLDIGAGVGAHALILQSRGFQVTALEISDAACGIMRERGVNNIINTDVLHYSGQQYDTLLMLMNGIGLSGDMAGLHQLIPKLVNLLNPGGQLLFDSSDISYLYATGDFPKNHYFGEISYQYEYQNIKGDQFKWLYIDFDRMKDIANIYDLDCELLYDDEMDQYLARMTVRTS